MRIATLAAAMVFVAMPLAAQDMAKAPKGTEATITGTVIDISCKFGQGLSGAEHRMCTQVCADNGLPLAILGEDGKLYVPTTAAMPGKGQNDRLKEFAEQKVTVRGMVFDAAGAKAIQVAEIGRAR